MPAADVLAMASPTHPVGPQAWEVWTRSYSELWGVFQGQEYLTFAPHFGHQYSHVWIDFRGIRDAFLEGRRSNRAAIALYQALGFDFRCELVMTTLTRG